MNVWKRKRTTFERVYRGAVSSILGTNDYICFGYISFVIEMGKGVNISFVI